MVLEKCVSLFKKIVATNLQSKNEEHCYPENEYSVIIKDISEGQEPLK